jgi:Fe-S cluster assembly protein SufD
MIGVSAELDVYLSSFAEGEKQQEQPWLRRLRQAAMDRFAELGFPTYDLEDWKFTSVAPIAKVPFQPAQPAAGDSVRAKLAELPLADFGCPRLVFVNGYFSQELSWLHALPAGIRVSSLAAALQESSGAPVLEEHLSRYARYDNHAFVALNTAFLRDGAFIEIPKGVVAGKPIHLLFVTTAAGRPAVAHPRNLILVARDAQASFIESYVSLSDQVHFTNAVTEIVAGENAVVEHYRIQQESPRAFHIATVQIYQDRSSSFTSHNISLGAAIARNDVNTVLDAEGAECALNGLYMVDGVRHVDNHTSLDHAKPHCASREVYKGILDGKAMAVFNGKIIVRKDAQKTDAKQTNKNLLLSPDATINTKPQLEIYADDVKCTHGATIGQLGEELIFYLRSRGIGLKRRAACSLTPSPATLSPA